MAKAAKVKKKKRTSIARKIRTKEIVGILFQRTPTSKFYFIHYTGRFDENGKRIRPWIDLRTTNEAEAIEQVKNIRAELAQKGRYDPPSADTFGEWLDFWLEEDKKLRSKKGEPLKGTTYDDYESTIRVHIKPKLGHYELRDLTPEILQRYYNAKQKENKLGWKKDEKGNRLPSDKPLSARVIQKIQMIIRASLDKAVAMHKLPENPDRFIDRVVYRRPKVKFLVTEQVADFLEKIQEDHWYPVYVTGFGTGARLSEITALRWDDIDFERGQIRFDEAVTTVKTHKEEGPKQRLNYGTTKSLASERIIPVPDDVIEVLKKWKTQQKEWYLQRGKNKIESNDLIFLWEDGHIARPEYLAHHFSKLAKKHGYDGITFHKQRHSFATMLLENGEEIKTIQEFLGHSSSEITADIYTHVAETLKQRAKNKLSGFTKKKTGQIQQ